MMVSFAMPWWSVHISEVPFKDAVTIYGYGFRHNLVELRTYVVGDETPLYQTVLAWVYVALSAVLMLFSTWLKGAKGSNPAGLHRLILYRLCRCSHLCGNRRTYRRFQYLFTGFEQHDLSLCD
jgi:hypothetical protein